MRIEPRRALLGLFIAGVAGAILLLPAIYVFGLSVAPALPVAAATPAPQLIEDALWARAGGGRAQHLRPIGPVALTHMMACIAFAPGDNDNERMPHCRHVMPALPGLEYLSKIHIQDHGLVRNSFIGGHAALATTVWMSRSWSRDEFVNTLAARGDFGFGWRGMTTAARRYFDRDLESLTLPQAALLASRLGDSRPDPWCEPDAAAQMRNGVLGRMLESGAIEEEDFQAASVARLDLAAPPEGRPPCRD
jgi:Transglycosylase